MKLKLACSDCSFPLVSFPAALDLIRMLEVPAVDIALFEGYKHLNPSVELAQPEAKGSQLRTILADREMTLADVFHIGTDRETLAPNNPDPEDNRKSRELFERALNYVKAAGGSHLTQLPGVNFPGVSVAENFERSARELGWRATQAAERGVVYAVEPHIGSIIETPADALRLIREAPGLTYALDYTHFTRAGYPDAEIEPLLRHASHFHVRGAAKGRLQAPFDKNTIDYKGVLRAMQKVGYGGYLGLEYVWIEWEHCNECDNLSEIIRFRDFLNVAAKEL